MHVFSLSHACYMTCMSLCKYMSRTAGYTWDRLQNKRTNCKGVKNNTGFLEKLLEYKRSWIQHVNRMPRNRLPRVMKHYCPTGRRNHGRCLKRLLDTWDRNGSTSGPTAWQIYDDDDDDNVTVHDLMNLGKFICTFHSFPCNVPEESQSQPE